MFCVLVFFPAPVRGAETKRQSLDKSVEQNNREQSQHTETDN